MASLGHIAVGMAAPRVAGVADPRRWRSMAWWSALSAAPDADVIGFALGVDYGDPWGHRGATHSIAFAIAAASIVALAAPKLGLSRLRAWLTASVVLVSHCLLDTLTNGGLGCALFWPFDLTRYFAPWRPIPVSPIGLSYFTPYGLFVAMTELILFAPLIVFALRHRRPAGTTLRAEPVEVRTRVLRRTWIAGTMLIWCAAVWLAGSTDPFRVRILSLALREQTEFAAGFSETGFRQIRAGQTIDEVRALLGKPIDEMWDYFSDTRGNGPSAAECPFVHLRSDRVVYLGDTHPAAIACIGRGIRAGVAREDILRALGPPRGMCWSFSRSRNGGYFRARVVCFDGGRVVEFWATWGRG